MILRAETRVEVQVTVFVLAPLYTTNRVVALYAYLVGLVAQQRAAGSTKKLFDVEAPCHSGTYYVLQ